MNRRDKGYSAGYTSLGGKSWTAYIRPLFVIGLPGGIAAALAWEASAGLGIGVGLVLGALLAFRCLHLRSYHLYFDDSGIWVSKGIFPWNKAATGVKWRDLDRAGCHLSFGSWLFKSYSIQIRHRFTGSSEIRLDHWRRGNKAVNIINDQHRQLVQANVPA